MKMIQNTKTILIILKLKTFDVNCQIPTEKKYETLLPSHFINGTLTILLHDLQA